MSFVPLKFQPSSLPSPVNHLGDGDHGEVWSTTRRGIVLKITDDFGEAAIASLVASDERFYHPGIVRYYAVGRLPYDFNVSRHELYTIWRDEVSSVGRIKLSARVENKLIYLHGRMQEIWSNQEFDSRIEDEVYDAIDSLSEYRPLSSVADSFRFWLRRGFAITDVRLVNLGRSHGQWKNFDPGHVVMKNERLIPKISSIKDL